MINKIKRGDSLDYLGVIPLDYADGYFQGWTPSAQIRTSAYELIDDLIVEWVDPDTTRSFTVLKVDTKNWPIGTALLDVQFVRDGGYTKSTDTIQISIIRDVTYPEPVV